MDDEEYNETRSIIEYRDDMSFEEYLQEMDIYIAVKRNNIIR